MMIRALRLSRRTAFAAIVIMVFGVAFLELGPGIRRFIWPPS
jgi:hypothetical protein